MSSKEIIDKFAILTMEAERHLNAQPNDEGAAQLAAIVRGVKMTSLGREIYNRRRKAAALNEVATQDLDIYRMTKEELITYGITLGLTIPPKSSKKEILLLVQSAKNA